MPSTPLRNKPSTATAAVITVAAVQKTQLEIDSIAWSYDTAPTGGNLKVESPSGTTIFELSISAAGPGQMLFSSGLVGAVSQAVIITLASGAGSVQGIVNAIQRAT